MEQFLTKNNNKVDAVVAANDGTAGGVVAALAAQGLAGIVPVSGPGRRPGGAQPRRARHADRSVWKDARELGKQRGRDRRRSSPSGKKLDRDPGRDEVEPRAQERRDERASS